MCKTWWGIKYWDTNKTPCFCHGKPFPKKPKAGSKQGMCQHWFLQNRFIFKCSSLEKAENCLFLRITLEPCDNVFISNGSSWLSKWERTQGWSDRQNLESPLGTKTPVQWLRILSMFYTVSRALNKQSSRFHPSPNRNKTSQRARWTVREASMDTWKYVLLSKEKNQEGFAQS